jgi:hypothetical protein
MRLSVAIFCLLVCSTAAWAQYGVSNQRDRYGNLVHNPGVTSPGSVNQGTSSNGAIRNTPPQPITNSTGAARGTGR